MILEEQCSEIGDLLARMVELARAIEDKRIGIVDLVKESGELITLFEESSERMKNIGVLTFYPPALTELGEKLELNTSIEFDIVSKNY